jgi:hypothetical protein
MPASLLVLNDGNDIHNDLELSAGGAFVRSGSVRRR